MGYRNISTGFESLFFFSFNSAQSWDGVQEYYCSCITEHNKWSHIRIDKNASW